MSTLRILADDLTGALDCAAAFGAGVPVHLALPGVQGADARIEIVATATRDVAPAELPSLLAPSLPWLRGSDIAFKKVDSLLRGNTFDEVDWLARQAPGQSLALVPAFPAQGRVTRGGQQEWMQADGTRSPVARSISEALAARGWQVSCEASRPAIGATPVAWVPDVVDDGALDAIARVAMQADPKWLWCGSAGLAHALARQWPSQSPRSPSGAPVNLHTPSEPTHSRGGSSGQAVMLVSASHHAVSREQWRVLRASHHAGECHAGEDPSSLVRDAASHPALIDLSAAEHLSAGQAAALLQAQAQAIAAHAPRPRVLVVVGGDTLLALCRALDATGLRSSRPLPRAGWGCATLVGGRWDGLVCHTRSGAFGGPQDLVEVVAAV